jgi:hypothetical protein
LISPNDSAVVCHMTHTTREPGATVACWRKSVIG